MGKGANLAIAMTGFTSVSRSVILLILENSDSDMHPCNVSAVPLVGVRAAISVSVHLLRHLASVQVNTEHGKEN